MARAFARELVRWLDELGRISDERHKLTRTFLSPAMRAANDRVASWMHGAGLAVREDQFGNLIGRQATRSSARTLLLGSHLDTVRDAGRFDGALGVLLPIAALAELRARGVSLPFAVEVIGFAEEEGVRFNRAYLGSKGYAGMLTAGDLAARDVDGMTVRDALVAWRQARSQSGTLIQRSRLRQVRRGKRQSDILGYVEVHIEQGPALEAAGAALGVVTAIAGQTRARLTWRGQAGHAGTTPMRLRRDAFAGAAEFSLWAESFARRSPPLVVTIGSVTVNPGAPNVIPGEVVLSVDVRHPRNTDRRSALRQLAGSARAIAGRRGLTLHWDVTQDAGAVTCSPPLTGILTESVRAVQGRSIALVSGAGHDGVVMSHIAPIAMLFVRCRGGLSHHPDEFASAGDIEIALRALIDFLERMARRRGTR